MLTRSNQQRVQKGKERKPRISKIFRYMVSDSKGRHGWNVFRMLAGTTGEFKTDSHHFHCGFQGIQLLPSEQTQRVPVLFHFDAV